MNNLTITSHPQNAFKMHINLQEKGTMKVDKWD